MSSGSSKLAKAITWGASKQSYLTARLMVDNDLADDAFRAYGYFRWVDDTIDVNARSQEERQAFIARQKRIVDDLYAGRRPAGLAPEEEIIADLIGRYRPESGGVHSYISKMMALMEFDAERKGRLISEGELDWYSRVLGASVIDAILFFVGREPPDADGDGRYAAGIAAHIVHMLRDMRADIREGFVNIPREYLERHALDPADVGHPAFRAWVRARADRARALLGRGEAYLRRLSSLRVKIVGCLYIARFGAVLDAIEREDYLLREAYGNRRSVAYCLKMLSVAAGTAWRHFGTLRLLQRGYLVDDRP